MPSKKPLLPLEQIAINLTSFNHLAFIALPRMYQEENEKREKQRPDRVYAIDVYHKRNITLLKKMRFGVEEAVCELPPVYSVEMRKGIMIGHELKPGSNDYNRILKWTGNVRIWNEKGDLYYCRPSTRNLLMQPEEFRRSKRSPHMKNRLKEAYARPGAYITREQAIELLR